LELHDVKDPELEQDLLRRLEEMKSTTVRPALSVDEEEGLSQRLEDLG